VALDTDIPVPAIAEVTPVLVKVTVSGLLTTTDIPVPSLKRIVSLVDTNSLLAASSSIKKRVFTIEAVYSNISGGI
jgi:hypothetical protein